MWPFARFLRDYERWRAALEELALSKRDLFHAEQRIDRLELELAAVQSDLRRASEQLTLRAAHGANTLVLDADPFAEDGTQPDTYVDQPGAPTTVLSEWIEKALTENG